jgi:hypothetical protein
MTKDLTLNAFLFFLFKNRFAHVVKSLPKALPGAKRKKKKV